MATGGLKLVFDEQFSHRQVEFVARESRLADLRHTRRMRWSGTPDKVWVPKAVQLGFVIVSADRNERTRGFTVADLKSMDARVILIGDFWNHWGRWDKAKWLVLRIEKIVEIAAGMTGGSAVLIVNRYCKARDL